MTGSTLVGMGDGGVTGPGAPDRRRGTLPDARSSGDVTDVGEIDRYQQLFHGHFVTMTRLAAMLGADDPEDIAQEAFVRLHRRRRALRDPHASLGYLRTTVVNLSRSRVRHLAVVRRNQPTRTPAAESTGSAESAEHQAVRREDARELVVALGQLSARHREALVLRYWLELNEAEMADAMGVSRGTVKAHVSRGLDALATIMGGTR
jgi:RNA polymerase sigma factor (sigma-70 family)